jgi:hypothetical protein
MIGCNVLAHNYSVSKRDKKVLPGAARKFCAGRRADARKPDPIVESHMTDAPNAPRPFQRLALRFLEYTGRLRPRQAKASPAPRLPNRARKSSTLDKARKNNTSGYAGVSWNGQRNKWIAHITIGSRRRYIGLFDNPTDAARAIEQARAQPDTYFENRQVLQCRARRSGRRWQHWLSS